VNRLTNAGANPPLFYFRAQSSSLRQKLFRSTFGTGAQHAEADEPEADKHPVAAIPIHEDRSAQDDEQKPRHRGFTLPAPARLNTEVGRQIGYDYAMAGLLPPEHAPLPFQEGFQSGRSKKPNKVQHGDQFERKVLRLRYSAWRRNRLFDTKVNAESLGALYRTYCPVTRIAMTTGTGLDTDATVERVLNGAAYALGNLVFMSAKANWAKANRTLDELCEISFDSQDKEGLPHVGWERLAAIANMYQPDPASMRLMPMHVLPPTGLLVNNPALLLQECVSSIAAGWEAQQVQILIRAGTPGKVGKRAFDNLIEFLRGAILRELRSGRKLTLAWTLENAWQQPGVFKWFASWYQALTPQDVMALVETNARLRPQAITRAGSEPLTAWSLSTRGYDRSDDSSLDLMPPA
jgi:hypothetical protein